MTLLSPVTIIYALQLTPSPMFWVLTVYTSHAAHKALEPQLGSVAIKHQARSQAAVQLVLGAVASSVAGVLSPEKRLNRC